MKRLTAFIKKLFSDKNFRFLFVGGLNTVVGYGTNFLFLFIGLRFIFSDEFYATVFATIISNIIGVTHSYFWNKYFTFRQKKKSVSEVVKFVFVYLVSFGLSTLINFVMVKQNNINPYLSSAVGIVTTTIVSFIGHNFFSFKQKKTNQNDENTDTVEGEKKCPE